MIIACELTCKRTRSVAQGLGEAVKPVTKFSDSTIDVAGGMSGRGDAPNGPGGGVGRGDGIAELLYTHLSGQQTDH